MSDDDVPKAHWEPPQEAIQCRAGDLVRFGGHRWRVTREGHETREFDDWNEADEYFRGEPNLIVARTIQAID